MIISAIVALSLSFNALALDAPAMDTPAYDTLATSSITTSLKDSYADVPAVTASRLSRGAAASAKEVSAVIPNFFQPDYGSRTTSSIYVRGFGSRIDQPAVGLYIDEIPVLNKSAYDFDFADIRSVSLLRGPQGTLYGRNTSSGVLIVRTLRPADIQGVRLTAEYSPAAAGSLSLSTGGTSRKGTQYGITVWGRHYDGDFRFAPTAGDNAGKKADRSLSAGFRSRIIWKPSVSVAVENILSAGYVNEGGYSYRQLDMESGELLPLSYNDPSRYRRLNIMDGLVVKGDNGSVRWSAAGSWQYLSDRMDLDNDFTNLSLFTMSQMQDEHAFTFEAMARRSDSKAAWQPLTGVFAFGKFLDLSAPVLFKRDGIDQLILANANSGIGGVFPGYSLRIREDEFLIGSDFSIPTGGIALFHTSSYSTGRWKFSAGLRLDAESASMRYDSEGALNYLFTMTMTDWRELRSTFKGRERQFFFEVLPSVEAEYRLEKAVFKASVRRGHKAGGFNTQIFSDILQNIMMKDLMSSLGVHMPGLGSDASAKTTAYRPEKAWDFEIGADFSPVSNLNMSASLFLIDCRNQQLTVMPSGNGTGRMMSNAGHTRSWGTEVSASYSDGSFYANADWGLAVARFIDYQFSPEVNYAGKRVPYAPANTFSSEIGYRVIFSSGPFSSLEASANCKGVGKIWWNEENTLSQPFYCTFGTNIGLTSADGRYNLSLWTKNLTDTRYNTFYFKSVSRSFYSVGRPVRAGIRLSIRI